MKRIVVSILFVLLASTAMAQFGSLKKVVQQEEKGNAMAQPKSAKQTAPSVGLSVLDRALQEGFVCIKQDFQLEDTLTRTLYNYGDNTDEFGAQISFMVKLDHGFIIPDEIMHPWDYDLNYPRYKNMQYVPVINRTSLLTISQNDWEKLDIPFWPTEKGELANGLKYAIDEKTASDGFHRFSGYGKKTVWIVWLLTTEQENSKEIQCQYVTEPMELTIEKGKKLYKMDEPKSKLTVLSGIVVEPIYHGIGHVDFALVGVIGKTDGIYNMAVIEPNMAEEMPAFEENNKVPKSVQK